MDGGHWIPSGTEFENSSSGRHRNNHTDYKQLCGTEVVEVSITQTNENGRVAVYHRHLFPNNTPISFQSSSIFSIQDVLASMGHRSNRNQFIVWEIA